MGSDGQRTGGKNKHKIPGRKEKSKREKLLNSNSEKKKENQEAKEQAKKEQTLTVIGRLTGTRLQVPGESW
jgi:hypothetical protein